jgi:N-acetylmuramic acid 6-phosphate etherase
MCLGHFPGKRNKRGGVVSLLLEETLCCMHGFESRSHVDQLGRLEDAASFCVSKARIEIRTSAQRRKGVAIEQPPRLGRFAKTCSDPALIRLENFAIKRILEAVATERRAATGAQVVDESRPFQALESRIFNAKGHFIILRGCPALCCAACLQFASGSPKRRAMADGRPTEAALERSVALDDMDSLEILRLIHSEDQVAHVAVGKVLLRMAEAVETLTCALSGGGRWFNVGAGTSGRLGVLDASEIPPTYGLSPRIVQGVIAGGDRALRNAVENAEDDAQAGSLELQERGLTLGDVVVGISASGTTPFVLGAIEAATTVGARTIAITCDPSSPLAESVEISIAPCVGPEVVTGSTRMKGGLAQKMILSALSTSVMVRMGRVRGNHMTHISPASSKLRGRAVRIVMELAEVDRPRAREVLRSTEGSVELALEILESQRRTEST